MDEYASEATNSNRKKKRRQFFTIQTAIYNKYPVSKIKI